jgi:hypothetical protein
MAENVENIEARLCAYVEDELNEAEREEIERHLAANPAHGALLQDMIRHRVRLRQLPREAAPRDLMEGLQSQLERDSLLGGESLNLSSYRSRLNRWPQMLSAAAIVLLAVGLGVIVYSFLPHGAPLAMTQPADQFSRLREPLVAERGGAEDAGTAKVAAIDEKRKAGDALAGDDGKPDTVAFNLAVDSTLIALGLRPDPAENGTLMITVTADDLKSANNEVVKFLSTNNIEWSEPKEQLALGRELTDFAYADSGQVSRMTNFAPRALAIDGYEKNAGQALPGGAVTEKLEASKLYAAPAPTRLEQSLGDKPQVALRSLEKKNKEEQPAAPQTVSKDTAVARESGGATVAAKPATAGAGGLDLSKSLNQQTTVNNNGANASRVILARNINSRQAAELAGSLSQLSEQRVRPEVQVVRADRAADLRGATTSAAENRYASRAELWYFKDANVAAEETQQGRARQYAVRWSANEADGMNLVQSRAVEAPLLNRKNAGLTQPEPEATARRAIVNGPQPQLQQQALGEESLTYFGVVAGNDLLRDQLAKSVIPADGRAYNCVIILQNSPTVANTSSPATQPAPKDAPTGQPLQKAINR